jgi:hypothetical protein
VTLDDLLYRNLTDARLLDTLTTMVVAPGAFSESARRVVIDEVRRRGLTTERNDR